MQQITILLDDEIAERLQALARQRGETMEQTAQTLLRAALLALTSTPFAPDDPDGSKALMAMAGSISSWPGHEGEVTHTTNEEIDRLIAEEAMNPHEDE